MTQIDQTKEPFVSNVKKASQVILWAAGVFLLLIIALIGWWQVNKIATEKRVTSVSQQVAQKISPLDFNYSDGGCFYIVGEFFGDTQLRCIIVAEQTFTSTGIQNDSRDVDNVFRDIGFQSSGHAAYKNYSDSDKSVVVDYLPSDWHIGDDTTYRLTYYSPYFSASVPFLFPPFLLSLLFQEGSFPTGLTF